MRPYRGKRKDNGEWVYGWYVHIEPVYKDVRHPKGVPHIDKIVLLDGSEYEVILETVGQSIGRKDKNGKKIYKGNLVKSKNSPIWEVKYQEEFCRYILWWNDPEDGSSYILFSPDLELEVIGNIHENSELLKEQQ